MKPPAWSHTALSDFETCPRKYKAVKIDKLFPFKETTETKWGKEVHKHFEHYILHGTPLPPALLVHKDLLDAFLAQPGDVAGEERLALDTNLKSCRYFGDPKIWYRGQVDARKRDIPRGFSHVLDHKTGKFKAELDQLKGFAMHEFLTQPLIHTIKAEYFWTQTNSFSGATFVREQLPEMLQYFGAKLNIFADAHINMQFPPRQSGLCGGWCEVTNCEFWRPKRK